MPRRDVFVTYHHADQPQVDALLSAVAPAFNNICAVGVTDGDDFINSQDTDYILRRIREKYVRGTSATIVLIGQCTWARRYVDWEIAATLRDNPTDPRGALLAVQLPSVDGRNNVTLPTRLAMNRSYHAQTGQELGYAGYYRYPTTVAQLAGWVEEAIWRRDNRSPAAGSASNLLIYNQPC